ncbi:FadR/GntR family transcriptional regulator [Microbacterium sp. NPDC058342]|uniref:FadR/GntR family transcriptional regulator n=1 Tax=Microbacterium sp. NPDC058342 TaxID=3346454 RepID=UPI00364654F8
MATSTRPRNRQPLSKQAQDAIRQYMIDHRIAPGEALPSEAEFAEILGMGKTSVREGLSGLVTLGIVEVAHGRGIYAGRFSFTPLVENLPYGLMVEHLPLVELLQVRRALEEGLIEQVAQSLTAEDIAALDALVDRMEAESSGGAVPTDVDRQFHVSLFGPLRNSLVTQLINVFWTIFEKAPESLKSTRVHHTAQMHRDILLAIRSGDGARMRRAVADHFIDIHEALMHVATQKAVS